MKKLLVLLFLMGFGANAFAQKRYVTVRHNSGAQEPISLTGDIPSNMKSRYNSDNYEITIGSVLNLLADNGFIVEQMSTVQRDGSSLITTDYLLSKSSNSTNPSQIIQIEKSDDEFDIHEVARYNLQGLPINENEKGIQIVVYSNYTTKTIIKE